MEYTTGCPHVIPNSAQSWTSGSWWKVGITVWKFDSPQLKHHAQENKSLQTSASLASSSPRYSSYPADYQYDYRYETDAHLYEAMVMIY
ncbi:MAG: hypothetical protein ACTS2F_24875 [Thainema sp.]